MKRLLKFKPIAFVCGLLFVCLAIPLTIHAITVNGGGPEFGWITHHNFKTGNASVLKTTLKKMDNGVYAYCLQPTKESPTGQNYKPGDKLPEGLFRILKNGYPNKSITGNKEKDYYITQVAVWIENGNYDRKTLTGDMLKYVDKLVATAKDSSDSSKTYVRFDKKNLNGYLSKDGKSYVTDWIKVEGNNISGTTTIDVKGAPEGTQLIDDNYLTGNKMKVGQKFYFKIPIEKVKSPIKIQFKGSGRYNSHAALCYLSPDSKYQNTASYVPITVNESTADYAVLNVNPSRGGINLLKTDAAGSNKLQGAEFSVVSKETNKEVGKMVTNKDGKATMGDLLMGDYIIKETKAPTGYEISTATKTVTVKPASATSVTFTDNPVHRQCMLRKVDSETRKPVAGATFELSKNGKVIGTFTSAPNGIVKLGDLAYGTYQVKEVKAPKGYIVSDKVFTFDVKETGNGKYEYDAPNTPVRGGVELYKFGEELRQLPVENKDAKVNDKKEVKQADNKAVDANKDTKVADSKDIKVLDSKETKDTKSADKKEIKPLEKKPLAGVKFQLFRKDCKAGDNTYLLPTTDKNATKNELAKPGEIGKDGIQLLGEFTTNAEGKVLVPNLLNGSYFFKEVSTAKGYIADATPVAFDIVNNGQVVKVQKENKPITGKVQITKLDLTTRKVLPNTEFEITDENGNQIVTGITDKNGIFEFGPLKYGKYFYRELKAPEGYLIDGNKYPFEIKTNDEIVKCEMTDKKITGKLQITKKDASTGALLPNTTFAIYDNNGKVVAKGKTDKNGIFEFGPLEYGKYFYQEIEAPKGYNIDTKKYPFEIKNDGEIIKCEMKDTRIPKTGDKETNPVIPVAGAGVVALAGGAYAFLKRR